MRGVRKMIIPPQVSMPEGETYVDKLSFREFKEEQGFGSVTVSIEALTLQSPVGDPMVSEPVEPAMSLAVEQAWQPLQDIWGRQKNEQHISDLKTGPAQNGT